MGTTLIPPLNYMDHRRVRNRIYILLLILFLFGCSSQSQEEEIHVIINIIKIVDKVTQQPITTNVITLRWENADGETIKEETLKDQSSFTTSLPADGETRLFITITSQGYKLWENGFRAKYNKDTPLSFPVEMERDKEPKT